MRTIPLKKDFSVFCSNRFKSKNIVWIMGDFGFMLICEYLLFVFMNGVPLCAPVLK
jgi:hypothetical protein